MEDKTANLVIVILFIAVVVLAVFFVLKLPTLRVAGMAETAIGTTTITVASETAITLTDSTVSFTLQQGGSNDSDTANDYFTAENSGNTKFDLDMNIWGEVNFTGTTGPDWLCWCKTAESGVCVTTYQDCNISVNPVVVTCLLPTEATDSANLGINVSIASDETAGGKEANVTFTATLNSSC